MSVFTKCIPDIGLRSRYDEIKQPVSNENKSQSQSELDIEDQSRVEIIIHEQNTIWHHLLCESSADRLLQIAQNKIGLTIGVVFVILYMIGLYTFDRLLFGIASLYYTIFILMFTLPGSLLYFGTLNVPICLSILKQSAFIFKIYNVILANICSVVWGYHNLTFDVISRPNWLSIYSIYFFINIVTAMMGCLVDGFKWSKLLKVIGPLLLAIYFTRSYFHWHYLECDTMFKFSLFGNEKDYLLTDVAANAVLNAALFFYGQSFYAFWYGDRASLLSATAILIWRKRGMMPQDLMIDDL